MATIDLRRLITADSLVDTGRTPRKPILPWLDGLIEKAAAIAKRGGKIASSEFSAVQNNFSLLTLLTSGTTAARRECIDQIRHAIAERAMDEVVQPWVNLARLDRIDGDVKGSAKKLAALRRLAIHGRVTLDGVSIGSESDRHFAASVFAGEYFHLSISSTDELTRHFRRIERLFGRKEHPLFAEQQIIAGTHHRDMGMVNAGLSNRAWFTDARTRLAGMYYRAVWAAQQGAFQPSEKLAIELLRLPVPIANAVPDHVMVRILFRAALLRLACGDTACATELFQRTEEYAECLADAEYAARAGAELERLGGLTTWREAAATSGYRIFRDVPPFFDGRWDSEIAWRLEQLRDRVHGLRHLSSCSVDGVAYA
ncbi:hypothetical protein J2T07_000414 [Luteibacter jiangsuensis]|uniref:Uncharacterized protein n=1 Tax=Luteibacter jiangsuensis TaxID=637577 RepID=A0ABT9STD4_9GAMM|nr:hypothetical protein [Luteibacter jiangsuensis]MDQ0008255.1 hypothetical protein [Luteibacter jiangsuensis]